MTKREELRALIERLESDHYKEGGPWTPWVSIAEVLPFLRDYADALEAMEEADNVMDAMLDRALPEDLRPQFAAALVALRKAMGKEVEK